ncbi:purine-nucleoside phosphorylase [Salegentibacter chungangensis]|uniref:Uridine phosphorylase n=1 Tax=Salegentibacter chungangensis TaxID=1335724 RepID=A0ABW3NQ80_9FLAO
MSVHIEAEKGQIAETVLLPGDPLRAKWIAESFLENAECYNKVRGMYGYTGTYKGQKVSVQGTGMGIPSALIYIHELINDYGVKNLIRVGSAGSYRPEVELRDVVLAMAASSTSGINNSRFFQANYAPTANFELFMKASNYARENNIPIKAGNVLSSDEFYEDDPQAYKKWAEFGVLCVEMETAGLYTIAAKYNVNALSILTVSDSLVTGDHLPAEERETGFTNMVEVALSTLSTEPKLSQKARI